MNKPTIGRVALVTGATGGIGMAVCQSLRALGTTVFAWDRTPPGGTSEPLFREVDITDSNAVVAGLAEIGDIDILIHTAGVLSPDSAVAPDSDVWQYHWNVNVVGTINVCAPVAAAMATGDGGAIVGVTSNAATTPRAGLAAYGATKAAMRSYLRTLALEVAPAGVRCNTVSPGSTDTPMLRRLHRDEKSLAQELTGDESATVIAGDPAVYRLGIPLQRIASPADVAAACVYLASPQAAHITMHDLRVDGGATLDA